MDTNTPSEGAASRKMLLELIHVANRHVAESEHRISRQRHLIAKLREKRQTTSTAEWFLEYLRTSRVVHIASRERLQRELATLLATPRAIAEATHPRAAPLAGHDRDEIELEGQPGRRIARG